MKRKLVLILCIIWMGIIFYNSSNSGYVSELRSHSLLDYIKSNYNKVIKKENKIPQKSQSLVNNTRKNSSVIKQINNNINVNKAKVREEKFNIILRKNAHAFEYLVLAFLVSAASFSFNIKGRSAVIYIMFICLFYAVTDEFHQMFVPGRTSLVSDVLIDFAGSIIGMCVFYLVYYKFFRSNTEKIHYTLY